MVTLDDIKAQAEKNMGVKDIAKKDKTQRAAFARGLFCKLSCELTTLPLSVIGRKAGIKHSTVLYWRDTFENMFATRKDMEMIYKITMRQLQEIGCKNAAFEEFEMQAENIVNSMLA